VACRERRPAHYLAVVASLLPKQLSIDNVWMKNPDEITREEPEAERPKVRGPRKERWCRNNLEKAGTWRRQHSPHRF
jgi:hypothetical protein